MIKMDVKDTKKSVDLDVGTKVTVQLMYTDPNIRTRKQIVKSSEKPGLYLALDIADAWLTRAWPSKTIQNRQANQNSTAK